MKVHRIITTIEVENDNSITSVELINLHPANADIPLAVTDIKSNGNPYNINKVYNVVDIYRLDIAHHLKGIVNLINSGLVLNDVCRESPTE